MMVDTRGSGIQYSREQIDSLTKLCDLYTNEKRCIYAELLKSEDGLVYFREWMTSSDVDHNFAIVNSIDELKSELKKDVDHGDLAPGKVAGIVAAVQEFI